MGKYDSKPGDAIAVVREEFYIAGSLANQSEIKAHRPGLAFTPVDDGENADLDVVLRAEPRNRFDSRAVAVRRGFTTLGHIPHEKLGWAHRELERAEDASLIARAYMRHYDGKFYIIIKANPDGV